jgi:hypothetical protein
MRMLEKHIELSLAMNILSTYAINMKGNVYSLNTVCIRFAVGC